MAPALLSATLRSAAMVGPGCCCVAAAMADGPALVSFHFSSVSRVPAGIPPLEPLHVLFHRILTDVWATRTTIQTNKRVCDAAGSCHAQGLPRWLVSRSVVRCSEYGHPQHDAGDV